MRKGLRPNKLTSPQNKTKIGRTVADTSAASSAAAEDATTRVTREEAIARNVRNFKILEFLFDDERCVETRNSAKGFS